MLCFEEQTEFDEDEALIVRIENIDGLTQQVVFKILCHFFKLPQKGGCSKLCVRVLNHKSI